MQEPNKFEKQSEIFFQNLNKSQANKNPCSDSTNFNSDKYKNHLLSKTTIGDDNITKSTQITSVPHHNYKDFSRKLQENSTPHDITNKEIIFNRYDNSPIKNKDFSPYNNSNYINSPSFNVNCSINLTSKLENKSNNKNTNLINPENYCGNGTQLLISPTFKEHGNINFPTNKNNQLNSICNSKFDNFFDHKKFPTNPFTTNLNKNNFVDNLNFNNNHNRNQISSHIGLNTIKDNDLLSFPTPKNIGGNFNDNFVYNFQNNCNNNYNNINHTQKKNNNYSNLNSINYNPSKIEINFNKNITEMQYLNNFHKGNPNDLKNFYKGIEIFRNPFEKKEENQSLNNPFTMSTIMEKMDKYEHDNSVHINNQLNFRHVPVIPYLNSKPNLNLKESRSRLNIFSKATENLTSFKPSSINYENNINYNYKNIPAVDYTNLKSKVKKNSIEENNFSRAEKNDEYISIIINNKDNLSLSNDNKGSIVDDGYARKLRRLEGMQKPDFSELENNLNMNEIPEEDSNNNELNDIYFKSDKNTEKNSENNQKKIRKIYQEDSEDESQKRKIPKEENLEELKLTYIHLWELCKVQGRNNTNTYDLEKFLRLVEEEMNLIIPLDKKNDEVYKRKMIVKKIQKKSFPEHQTARRSDTYYGKQTQDILEQGNFFIFFLKFYFSFF